MQDNSAVINRTLLMMFRNALNAYKELGGEGLKEFLDSIKTNYGVTAIGQMTPQQKQDFICELLLLRPPCNTSKDFKFCTVEEVENDALKTAVKSLMSGFGMSIQTNKLIYIKDK